MMSGPSSVHEVRHEVLAEELKGARQQGISPIRAWRYPTGAEGILIGRHVAVGFPDGTFRGTPEDIAQGADRLAVAATLLREHIEHQMALGPASRVPFTVSSPRAA